MKNTYLSNLRKSEMPYLEKMGRIEKENGKYVLKK